MSISTFDVKVKTTAVRLRKSEESGKAMALVALKANAGTVYIGGSDVTTANGLPIEAGNSFSLDTFDIGRLYCIGTENDHIRVMVSS